MRKKDLLLGRVYIWKNSRGFTLIELLMVIAVLGVLAAVVLVAIDPVQQLARGRDSGRKTSIGQLGRALQAYYTSQTAYPPMASWSTDLVNSGEIKTFPSNPPLPPLPTTSCPSAVFCVAVAGADVNHYCYRLTIPINANHPSIIVFTKMESKSQTIKCPTPANHYERTFYAYSSLTGRAGIVCMLSASDDGCTGNPPSLPRH